MSTEKSTNVLLKSEKFEGSAIEHPNRKSNLPHSSVNSDIHIEELVLSDQDGGNYEVVHATNVTKSIFPPNFNRKKTKPVNQKSISRVFCGTISNNKLLDLYKPITVANKNGTTTHITRGKHGEITSIVEYDKNNKPIQVNGSMPSELVAKQSDPVLDIPDNSSLKPTLKMGMA
jgi:hypothetical protein